MTRWLVFAGFAVLAGVASCAHVSSDETVCPEFRNLRCLTPTDCTMDNARGCQVCQCRPADQPMADPNAPVGGQ